MPRSYLIANWKMNLPEEGIDSYCTRLSDRDRPDEVELIVAPPYPYLDRVRRLAAGGAFELAAQDCSDEHGGAYTGEVSARMLRETGARYVIIGHSERRTLYGETSLVVAAKLVTAVTAGLIPVLCIGENLETRDSGETGAHLSRQLRDCLSDVLEQIPIAIIAYEPIWAIGTGRNASSEMVAETSQSIRRVVGEAWSETVAERTPVLYGGSVTPENVDDLAEHGGIDGFLVGGASLQSARLLEIHAGLCRAATGVRSSPC